MRLNPHQPSFSLLPSYPLQLDVASLCLPPVVCVDVERAVKGSQVYPTCAYIWNPG
jgi:hypothetical protein